jgi:hypothetical protein
MAKEKNQIPEPKQNQITDPDIEETKEQAATSDKLDEKSKTECKKSESEIPLSGLEVLSDVTLARIVDNDVFQNGSIKSQEADIAFKELTRRSDF